MIGVNRALKIRDGGIPGGRAPTGGNPGGGIPGGNCGLKPGGGKPGIETGGIPGGVIGGIPGGGIGGITTEEIKNLKTWRRAVFKFHDIYFYRSPLGKESAVARFRLVCHFLSSFLDSCLPVSR